MTIRGLASINGNFNSLFGTSSSTGINLGDYSSIKSGSYKKLLKAYYKPETKETTSTTKKDKVTKTQADTTGLKAMKTDADALKTATSNLMSEDTWKTTGGALNKDNIAKAVQKFVDEYNGVLDQAAKVKNQDVAQQTRFMTSMTNTMSKALSKVGVSVDTDGKMKVDAEALKAASDKDLKAAFSGQHSYASQISDYAGAIASAAMRNSTLYTGAGTLANSFDSVYNNWT